MTKRIYLFAHLKKIKNVSENKTDIIGLCVQRCFLFHYLKLGFDEASVKVSRLKYLFTAISNFKSDS